MYDKTVRRRRAVLGLLVAGSLILLTAYFGESSGGGLHAVQRGSMEVLAPIQEGANRALKPVRDLFGWFGDTIDAKGDVKSLRQERDQLRQQAIRGEVAIRERNELAAQLKMNADHGLADDGPTVARVIGLDPSLWYSQVQIDKGTDDGVHTDQPVVTGEGLIGKVKTAAPTTAIVTLITDHTTQVGGVIPSSGVSGLVEVEAGRPTDLVLSATSSSDIVKRGQTVVTSGTLSKVGRLPSPYPANIPIGRVTRIENAGSDDQQVHVTPFADLRRLDFVEVLTKAGGAR